MMHTCSLIDTEDVDNVVSRGNQISFDTFSNLPAEDEGEDEDRIGSGYRLDSQKLEKLHEFCDEITNEGTSSFYQIEQEENNLPSNNFDDSMGCNQDCVLQEGAINVLVMTVAGKPIFARFGGEESVARICSLIAALQTTLSSLSSSSTMHKTPMNECNKSAPQPQELQFFQSHRMLVVFAQIESIVLMALCTNPRRFDLSRLVQITTSPTIAMLRLQLEHVYAQILSVVTLQLQNVLCQDPSVDVRDAVAAMMASGWQQPPPRPHQLSPSSSSSSYSSWMDLLIDDVLEDAALNPERIWMAALPAVVGGMSNPLRQQASHRLWNVGQATPHTVFAMLILRSVHDATSRLSRSGRRRCRSREEYRFVTMVQPAFRPHRMRVSDWHILTRWIRQRCCDDGGDPSNPATGVDLESTNIGWWWFPLCFPRFHVRGYMHAYVENLLTYEQKDEQQSTSSSSLLLVLVSQVGSGEQLQSFRDASKIIRTGLRLPLARKILISTASTTSSPTSSTLSRPLKTKRSVLEILPPARLDGTDEHDMGNDGEGGRTVASMPDHAATKPCTHNPDDDYVDASGDGEGIIPYLPEETPPPSPSRTLSTQPSSNPWLPILQRQLFDPSNRVGRAMQEYLQSALAWHFVFRLNAPMSGTTNHHSGSTGPHLRNANQQTPSRQRRGGSVSPPPPVIVGHVSQCLSAPWPSAFGQQSLTSTCETATTMIHVQGGYPDMTRLSAWPSPEAVWNVYQRLALRLRLGSAQTESVYDALDMIAADPPISNNNTNNSNGRFSKNRSALGERSNAAPTTTIDLPPTIARQCPTMGLVEAPPNLIGGMTYCREGSQTYMALNGPEFELYFVTCETMPIQQVAAAGTRLARRLLADQKTLFLSNPLTWME